MSMHQYIGARYVPAFKGTYVNTTAYENLDVVDDGYGTSYIAKKLVPPGTPLTDTEYWALYGASSGAIINLQNRMGAAENNIDELYTIADKRKFTKGTVIFISDSYGTHTPQTFIDSMVSDLGITNYVKKCYGSIGFAHVNDGETFETMLNAAIADVTDPNDVTAVFVLGGMNDTAESASDVYNAMVSFMNNVTTNLPNAKCYVGFIGKKKDYLIIETRAQMIGVYQRINELGGLYLNGSENIINYGMLSDNLHPTEADSLTAGHKLSQIVLTGSYDLSISILDYVTYVNTTSNVYNNRRILLTGNDKTLTLSTNQANGAVFASGAHYASFYCNGITKYDLFNLPSSITDYLWGSGYSNEGVPATMNFIANSGSDWTPDIPCYLFVEEGKVKFSVFDEINFGSPKTYNDINYIMIPKFHITIPYNMA